MFLSAISMNQQSLSAEWNITLDIRTTNKFMIKSCVIIIFGEYYQCGSLSMFFFLFESIARSVVCFQLLWYTELSVHLETDISHFSNAKHIFIIADMQRV